MKADSRCQFASKQDSLGFGLRQLNELFLRFYFDINPFLNAILICLIHFNQVDSCPLAEKVEHVGMISAIVT